MLFFKQKPSLNENNRVKENNLIDANNVTNINNKDLLVFKDNFLWASTNLSAYFLVVLIFSKKLSLKKI